VLTTDECVWPNCAAPRSAKMPGMPICDRHAIATYRKVEVTLREAVPPRPKLVEPTKRTKAFRNARDRMGTVYFMRFGRLVKIGFSTNIRSRVSSLRPDELLATMPGTLRDEDALHHKFGSAWVHGEYFEATSELMAFIDDLSEVAPLTGQG
jgi:hypothetical protein